MTPIAEIHDYAVRLLRRLDGLDIGRTPRGLRDRLLAQRADLEALIEITTPDNAPRLAAAFNELSRRLTIDELWTMIRVEALLARPARVRRGPS